MYLDIWMRIYLTLNLRNLKNKVYEYICAENCRTKLKNTILFEKGYDKAK